MEARSGTWLPKRHAKVGRQRSLLRQPMAHDRTGEDTLPLTHEFLALGVRRAGVTEALQSLKRQNQHLSEARTRLG
jgi:hypothetical protein